MKRILLYLLLCLSLSSINAMAETIPKWSNPGGAPFSGSIGEGCELVNGVSGLDVNTCVSASEKLRAVKNGEFGSFVNDDRFRIYHFQQGEKAITTETSLKTGKSRAVERIVDFRHKFGEMKGKPFPSNHPIRRALIYMLADGTAIAFPDACRNLPTYFDPQLKNIQPVAVETIVKIKKELVPRKDNCVCYGNSSKTTYSGNIFGGSVGQCTSTPIGGTSSFTDGGAGRTCVCN